VRGKPAIVIVVATVPRRRLADDAGLVTLTAPTRRACVGRPRRALWRLDPSRRHPRGHPTPDGPWSEPEDFELCLALLDEAIARAERWCVRRERALAEFDLRAVEMVRRLRVAGILPPSTTWGTP
jgi:hypothetical protein